MAAPQKCITKGCKAKPEDLTSFFSETVKFKGDFHVFKIYDCQKCKTHWKNSDKILSSKEAKEYKIEKRNEEEKRKKKAKKIMPIVNTFIKNRHEAKK